MSDHICYVCPDCDNSWQEHELFFILTDLIAELRGYRHRARNDMADYYEQRLQEVQSE